MACSSTFRYYIPLQHSVRPFTTALHVLGFDGELRSCRAGGGVVESTWCLNHYAASETNPCVRCQRTNIPLLTCSELLNVQEQNLDIDYSKERGGEHGLEGCLSAKSHYFCFCFLAPSEFMQLQNVATELSWLGVIRAKTTLNLLEAIGTSVSCWPKSEVTISTYMYTALHDASHLPTIAPRDQIAS